MPTDYSTLEMGPCSVTFKTVDLGMTKGGVEVEFSTEVTPITVDQFGDTPINNVIKGRAVKVKVPIAENDITKFAAAFPGTQLVTSGANKKLVFKSAVGLSLRESAGALVLHPKGRATNDKSRDFVVPVAMAKGDMSFAYKHDEQRVFMLEFEGYANLDTDELFVIGDPAITGV